MKTWKMKLRPVTFILLLFAGLNRQIPAQNIRLASFNIKEMSSKKLQQVDKNGIGQNDQIRAAAAIIQQIDPDILVLNEIDHDYSVSDSAKIYTVNCERFLKAYLPNSHFRYVYSAPCNTGILSGFDLNNDGLIATEKQLGTREHGDDCFGWGTYPGQYSMAVLSKFPIVRNKVRTFQKFLWKDLPGHHIPENYYSTEELAVFRLSSKSHWDVPVQIGKKRLHLLMSHPTPPAFDGPEDKNGRRNFDEIKFWKLYLENAAQIYDDAGVRGGLAAEDAFIIMGDLNAALQSDSEYDNQKAIELLLKQSRVQDSGSWMNSAGARLGSVSGPPDFFEQATTEFRKGMKRRIDYILPSKNLTIVSGGVMWPDPQTNPALYALTMLASDHRAVWLDVNIAK